MRQYTPRTFTDAQARSWEIIDFRTSQGGNRRLRLGDPAADARAFFPFGRSGSILIHWFGYTPHHGTTEAILNEQVNVARPSTAAPEQRRQGQEYHRVGVRN